MHGALYFLGFLLLTWGAVVRLIFIRSLLRAIKTYFWTTLFIGILFLFQHEQTLGTVQLFLIFPGLVFLVLSRSRLAGRTVTYPWPNRSRWISSGFLFLALLAAILFLLSPLVGGHGELILPLAAGLIVMALGLTGLTARSESILRLFFLSLLFQGAALTLLAWFRGHLSWEKETGLIVLILTGPLLLGLGAYRSLRVGAGTR